jgi:hypothetical protein
MRSVYSTIGNFGSLGIEAEDTADVVVQFDSGLLGTIRLGPLGYGAPQLHPATTYP